MRVVDVVVHQLVYRRITPSMLGCRALGEPPRMLAVDHPMRHAVEQIGRLADLTVRAFDPHPVALLDAPLLGVIGVDLAARRGPYFAAPRQLAMLGVEIHRDAAAGQALHRVLLPQFRVAIAAVGVRAIIGQRILSTMIGLHDGAPYLLLLRRRVEAGDDVMLVRRLGVAFLHEAGLIATIRTPIVRAQLLDIPPAVFLELVDVVLP